MIEFRDYVKIIRFFFGLFLLRERGWLAKCSTSPFKNFMIFLYQYYVSSHVAASGRNQSHARVQSKVLHN